MSTDLEAAFAARFGRDQADLVMAAAEEHRNTLTDNGPDAEGTGDRFKWVLMMVIANQCVHYADSHGGIKIGEDEFREWVYDTADLSTYDGRVDMLALLVGAFEGFVNRDEARWRPGDDEEVSEA